MKSIFWWTWWIVIVPIFLIVFFLIFFTTWIGWVIARSTRERRKELLGYDKI